EALGDPPVATHDPADPAQLEDVPFLAGDNLVERVHDFASKTSTPAQPDLNVAGPQACERIGELAEHRTVRVTAAVACLRNGRDGHASASRVAAVSAMSGRSRAPMRRSDHLCWPGTAAAAPSRRCR